MSMSEPVNALKESNVGIIELARPDKFNCLSTRTWQMIGQAREGFEADETIRAILIRAQGKNFCTGADLDEAKATREDRDSTAEFIARGHMELSAFEASPLPVVAAVQGLCLAGGLELMLAADVVFAGTTARFGDQHAQYGLVPGWGGSQRLPRLIGPRRAMDIMFSARWLEASEARDIGLVNTIVGDDNLHAEALAYAARLTDLSRRGLAEMKRLVRRGLDLPLNEALRLEQDTATRHLLGPDTAEGLAAFEARRKPNFE